MMNKSKEMTSKQRERQSHRENGRYAKVNPCYSCGKSAGVDYHSHKDTDGLIDDELLCLCEKCADWLHEFDGVTACEKVKEKYGGLYNGW